MPGAASSVLAPSIRVARPEPLDLCIEAEQSVEEAGAKCKLCMFCDRRHSFTSTRPVTKKTSKKGAKDRMETE